MRGVRAQEEDDGGDVVLSGRPATAEIIDRVVAEDHPFDVGLRQHVAIESTDRARHSVAADAFVQHADHAVARRRALGEPRQRRPDLAANAEDDEVAVKLRDRVANAFRAAGVPGQVSGAGSLFRLLLTDRPLRRYRPTRTVLPAASILFSPAIPVMSTSSSGEESRMLSAGMRLLPPARTCAPGRPSSSSASSSERGFA